MLRLLGRAFIRRTLDALLPLVLIASSAGSAVAATDPTTGIIVAECRYGRESDSGPLRFAFVFRPDGTVTRTTTVMNDFTRAQTQSATIGVRRFRELANRIDRSTFYGDAPLPAPDASGAAALSAVSSDTRDDRLAGRTGIFWRVWSLVLHRAGEDYEDLMSAVIAAASDPALRWRPAPLQENAFAVCTPGTVIGSP